MNKLSSLLGNLRFYILSLSIILATGLYLWVRMTIPLEVSQAIQLTQLYGLISIVYLYLTLLASPLTRVLTFLPFRGEYLYSRRALGVSSFIFATLHFLFAFFGELDGFDGLGFLDTNYWVAIGISFTALLILAAMAVTANDALVEKLTFPKWKMLHRLVYLASLLVFVHILILGSHFTDLSSTIPEILFAALAILLILEAIRFDLFLSQKFESLPRVGISLVVIVALMSIGGSYLLLPSSGGGSTSFLNVHAQHIALAKQAQQGQGPTNLPPSLANNPAFIGDRTLRYGVSFNHPQDVEPNQDTTLDFQVFNASSGTEVDLFNFVYSKLLHLIIVDDKLEYFNHIHPVQKGSHFLITTQFPHPGVYHLYLDFQPLGAIEQQFAVSLNVGNVSGPTKSTQPPDPGFASSGSVTKTFGGYSVTMKPSDSPLIANLLSVGNETITFTIKDAKTGAPVTTLKPYLAAFGHLTLINEQTYDYIHVHPSNIFPPAPDANGGPDVEFLPLGLYGPIKPGIYRVFAEFNPNNQLFTSDFTIAIK